jgi:hypothetical protein
MNNPSSRTHFKFGTTANGGHSKLKLLVYFEGKSKPDLRYSFDGRPNQAQTSIKAYDRAKYFNEENGKEFLEELFQKEFRYQQGMSYAIIADANGVGDAAIKQVWSKNLQLWTSKIQDNQIRYQAHQAVKKQTDTYTLRLSVPTYAPVKFHSFYTQNTSTGAALLDLIGQYIAFKRANPLIRFQERGQIYGNCETIRDKYEREVPLSFWFDTHNKLPKYLKTDRIVKGYADFIKSNQYVEEFIV